MNNNTKKLTTEIPNAMHNEIKTYCNNIGIKPASMVKLALSKMLQENER